MPSVYSFNTSYIESEEDIPYEYRNNLSKVDDIIISTDFISGLKGKTEYDRKSIQSKFSNLLNCYFGHGTPGDEDVIASILKSGLKVKDSREFRMYSSSLRGLDSTTIPFGQGSDKLFDEQEYLLNNWKHKDSRNIVIVSLPFKYMLPRMYIKQMTDQYKVFYLGNEEIGYNLRPEFILGIYNADTKTLVNNKNYYDNLSEEEKEKIDHELKKNFVKSFSEIAVIPPCEVPNLPLDKGNIELCTLMWYKNQLNELQSEKENYSDDLKELDIGDFDSDDWDIEEDSEFKK